MDSGFTAPDGDSNVAKGGNNRKSAIKSDFDTPQQNKKKVQIKAESSGGDNDNSEYDAPAPKNASPPWDVNASSSPEAKGYFDGDSEDENGNPTGRTGK